MTSLTQQPQLYPQPNIEPPGFPGLRDMLTRQLINNTGNPYGYDPAAGQSQQSMWSGNGRGTFDPYSGNYGRNPSSYQNPGSMAPPNGGGLGMGGGGNGGPFSWGGPSGGQGGGSGDQASGGQMPGPQMPQSGGQLGGAQGGMQGGGQNQLLQMLMQMLQQQGQQGGQGGGMQGGQGQTRVVGRDGYTLNGQISTDGNFDGCQIGRGSDARRDARPSSRDGDEDDNGGDDGEETRAWDAAAWDAAPNAASAANGTSDRHGLERSSESDRSTVRRLACDESGQSWLDRDEPSSDGSLRFAEQHGGELGSAAGCDNSAGRPCPVPCPDWRAGAIGGEPQRSIALRLVGDESGQPRLDRDDAASDRLLPDAELDAGRRGSGYWAIRRWHPDGNDRQRFPVQLPAWPDVAAWDGRSWGCRRRRRWRNGAVWRRFRSGRPNLFRRG
jgi:hypothetical protein